MRKILLSLFMLAASAQVGAAESNSRSIADLRGFCIEGKKLLNKDQKYDLSAATRCLGFLQGFTGGYQVGLIITGHKSPPSNGYCPPETASFHQRMHIFLDWAERNPALWHEPWSVGLFRSYIEAWPCKK